MDFIGTECIVCNKKFLEDDDIVVCEVCGTPYHRECYHSVKKCINVEYHINGWTFKEKQHESQKGFNQTKNEYDTDEQEITNRKDNSQNEEIIENNYNEMIDTSNELLTQFKINPEEKHSGVTLLEFYLYTKSLGNTKKFHKSVNNQKVYSILTFLFPEYYMISKNMYVPAIFTFLINFFLNLPCFVMYFPSELYGQYQYIYNLVSNASFKVVAIVFLGLSLIFRLFSSNKCLTLYFKQCIENINLIKKSTQLKNKSYNEFLKKLVNVRNGANIFAMMLLSIGSNMLYSNFYFILDLLLICLGTNK